MRVEEKTEHDREPAHRCRRVTDAGTCMVYAWSMHGVCMVDAWWMHGICIYHAHTHPCNAYTTHLPCICHAYTLCMHLMMPMKARMLQCIYHAYTMHVACTIHACACTIHVHARACTIHACSCTIHVHYAYHACTPDDADECAHVAAAAEQRARDAPPEEAAVI